MGVAQPAGGCDGGQRSAHGRPAAPPPLSRPPHRTRGGSPRAGAVSASAFAAPGSAAAPACAASSSSCAERMASNISFTALPARGGAGRAAHGRAGSAAAHMAPSTPSHRQPWQRTAGRAGGAAVGAGRLCGTRHGLSAAPRQQRPPGRAVQPRVAVDLGAQQRAAQQRPRRARDHPCRGRGGGGAALQRRGALPRAPLQRRGALPRAPLQRRGALPRAPLQRRGALPRAPLHGARWPAGLHAAPRPPPLPPPHPAGPAPARRARPARCGSPAARARGEGPGARRRGWRVHVLLGDGGWGLLQNGRPCSTRQRPPSAGGEPRAPARCSAAAPSPASGCRRWWTAPADVCRASALRGGGRLGSARRRWPSRPAQRR
jgi:hypothetical protein